MNPGLKGAGLRKGRRRSLHIPGVVFEVTGEGPYQVVIKRLDEDFLCTLGSEKAFESGDKVWIVVTPSQEPQQGLKLTKRSVTDEHGVKLYFDEGKSSRTLAELIIDHRGRAQGLAEGAFYRVSLLPQSEFYKAYERGSRRVSEGGRSEPDPLGEWRLNVLTGHLDSVERGEWVVDCATGPKPYLRTVQARSGKLICLNYSLPILMRTKEWFEPLEPFFVRYNADKGLPFKRESIGVAVVDGLLEYLERPFEFLDEMSQTIKPGGSIMILEPLEADGGPDYYPQDLWELALWRSQSDPGFSKESIQKHLEDLGFTLEDRKKRAFTYTIFEEQEFSQSIGLYMKEPK